VKMLGFKKKNLIALALAAVVAVSGFGVYQAKAAGKIDETKQCTVSVSVQNDSTSTNPFSNYKGYVTVRFYKVADVDAGGNYDNAVVDLSKLSGSNVKADDLDAVAKAAYEYFKLDKETPEKPDGSVSFDLSDIDNATAPMDKGLYLFVPQPTQDDYYDYTFKYSLVSVPTSKYITSTKVGEDGSIVADNSASDAWEYDVDIILKPEAKVRYGKLQINKTLNTFNESLGTASFVFEVEATKDDKLVFSNVYTLNFDSATTKSVVVEKIPAGAVCKVKEVYSGASYTNIAVPVVDAENTGVTIVADETQELDFVNDYDERLIEGGLGIENHFVKSNDELSDTEFEFDGSNITNNNQESEGQ